MEGNPYSAPEPDSPKLPAVRDWHAQSRAFGAFSAIIGIYLMDFDYPIQGVFLIGFGVVCFLAGPRKRKLPPGM